MNKVTFNLLSIVIGLSFCLVGCDRTVTSDTIQQAQQETLLREGTAQVGMPAIKNFRERKLMKDILEKRDQANFITYTYLENQLSKVVPGVTALGGKLTFLGVSSGFPIPYSTQFTSPQKDIYTNINNVSQHMAMPQADPNGLFSPASAEGSWVMLQDPNNPSNMQAVYVEPRVITFPFKLPVD